ncbi:MAG: MerR family transcriptional regulator [Pelagimonas sp.]
MRIGELAERCGISRDTLRLYEREGLISSVRRNNGYRDFDPRQERVVTLIRQAQVLGFSLADIRALLVQMRGSLGEDEVRALLRQKLAEIDAKIAGMEEIRRVIETRIEQACPLQLDQI